MILEATCPDCDGTGWSGVTVPLHGTKVPCSRCDGCGKTPTLEGTAVLNLIRNNWTWLSGEDRE